jgi:twitching motility protein PilT
MARLDSFLRLVVEQRASDLHFTAGSAPIIRLDGELIPLPFRRLSDLEARRFIFEILTPDQRQALETEKDLDFIYELEGMARFRGNAFVQSRGIAAVFRVIPLRIPTMAELGMPPVVKRLTELSNGLVLVTGPTGSGKTTTLAALVHEINTHSRRHIITIEDPIEFVHAETFTGALRSALRESPDVIVVGELRDLETVSLALSAAETGVLVFGTLHTNSAAKSIHRIVDIMPEERQDQMRAVISVLLRGVVAQYLCKRRGGEGRVAATEILLQDYAIANMIREDKLHQLDALLQTMNPKVSGMQSLDRCLLDLVKAREVEIEDAMKLASYPEKIRELAQALNQEEE